MATPSFRRISKQHLLDHFASRHSVDSKTWRHLQQSVICWSASSVLAIIAGAVLAYVMSSRRPAIGYGQSRTLHESGVIYTCEDASDDVREAIDYYQDPCEDFHAFACGQHDPIGDKRRFSVADMIQDSLMSGMVPFKEQSAMQKVQVFYRSCLGASFNKDTLKVNFETYFRVVEAFSHQAEKLSSFSGILDLVADLSLRWGISTFLSLSVDSSGSFVIRLGKPLTLFMTDDDLKVAVETLTELLNGTVTDASPGTIFAAVKAVDGELSLLTRQPVKEVRIPFTKLSEILVLSLTNWTRIVDTSVGTRLTSNATAIVAGIETIKSALGIVLGLKDLNVVRIYTLLHAILPQDFVTASSQENDGFKAQHCTVVVRGVFEVVWKDVVIRSLTRPETLNDVQFMSTAVVVSLKKLLRQSSLFDTVESLATVLSKLDRIHFNLPRTRSDLTLSAKLSGLTDLNVTNYYANLLKTQRFVATRLGRPEERGLDPDVPRVLYHSDVIEVAAASLTAPGICYGSPKVLNYASVGFDIAEQLLNAIEWPPVLRGNFSAARLSKLYSCSSELVKMLGEEEVAHWNLGKVVRLRSAFEAVSEATKLEARREGSGEAEPAVVQTLLARYCRRWWNATASGGLSSKVKCNVALMGQSEFLNLFRCEEDQRMVPKRQCNVFR